MIDWIQALWLALIQGITEFLPISSSAHLVLPSQVLGWPDQGLAFDVAVHLGTLLAVMLWYRRDLARMTAGAWVACRHRQVNDDARLAIWVVLATLPAIAAGFLLKPLIESDLRSVAVIIFTTLAFGVLLGLSDLLGKRQRSLLQLGLVHALVIGVAQALALVPGTSRSGITMTAALLLGYQREAAARFSFLLSIPVILGAATLKLNDLLQAPAAVDWGILLLGFSVSAITAWFTIALFLRLLERLGMWPWVGYRLVLGLVLLWLVY